jgi:hypothetical protein
MGQTATDHYITVTTANINNLAMYWNCFTVASRGTQLTKRVSQSGVKY